MKPSTTMKAVKKAATSRAGGGLCLVDKLISIKEYGITYPNKNH